MQSLKVYREIFSYIKKFVSLVGKVNVLKILILTNLTLTPKSLQMVTAAMKLKDACSSEEKLCPTQRAYQKAETLLYQQRSICQNYGFSSGHVWM